MNQFDSKGGAQHIAQGDHSIGQQSNSGCVSQTVTGDSNIIAGTGPVHVEQHIHQPAPPVIPRQLPAPEPCFLHREQELVWLNERLHPGKVAAVCGPGGMGKSALAAQAVNALEPARFPDGIIFHSFYHQPKVEAALHGICAALQVQAQAGLESAVQQALSGRKALLILDGAEEADDLPALLRLRGSCGVLITSRKRSDALAERYDLKPLDEQPAEAVFLRYSGPVSDAESVQGICTLLGGWPVALRIAGRYISSTGESAADYLKWLRQEPFKELASGTHQEENAALLLRRSVAQVSDDARLALGVAGCLAFAPLVREPVAAILEDDERRARTVLGELVTYGLLEKQQERWQTSHALIHAYAREELALSKESLERLSGWYIDFCQTQSAAGVKGYAVLDGERAHCLRLMESCLASKLWAEVKGLVWEINLYLREQGYWIDLLDVLNMRLIAAQQAGDLKDEGVSLNNLGYTCLRRGDYANALYWYHMSLTVYQELGDREGQGATLNGIATVYNDQGNHEQAMHCYNQCLTIIREVGDMQGEGSTLNNIGRIYSARGDYETALRYYKQSLTIIREVGDKSGEGITIDNIAAMYRAQGYPTKALEYHKQALAILSMSGDRVGEAETRQNIGVAYADQGDFAKAEEHISLAVQLAEKIGHPSLQKWRDGLAQVRAKRQA